MTSNIISHLLENGGNQQIHDLHDKLGHEIFKHAFDRRKRKQHGCKNWRFNSSAQSFSYTQNKTQF